jgi:hypothetical protein
MPQDSVPTPSSRSRTLLAAPCKGPAPYRISPTRGHWYPISALQTPAAGSSGLTWALLRAVKTPMLVKSPPAAAEPTCLPLE